MSAESWIGLAAIMVTLALAGAGTIFCIGGWFLTRLIREKDRQVDQACDDIQRLKLEVIRLETVLFDRGIMPIKYPSPPPHGIEGTSE